jgi:subtilisin family serine protease
MRLETIAAAFVVAAVLAPAARAEPLTHDEVIVKFVPGLSPAERADALQDRGARLARRLRVARTMVVRVDDAGTIAALERDPRVAWAQPNTYQRAGAVPDDPFLEPQWGLDNTGQTVLGEAGRADADIDAPEAWERTTGSAAVKVAVVDSGVNLASPDLAPNIWHNPGESGGGREHNGVDDDGNGFVDDWRGWDFVQQDNDPSDNLGHGTHVAGTLAARGNDGLGVSGVAWRASIIPVRALDNRGWGSCAALADAMAYAVRAGARVVNASIGGPGPCQAERDVIDAAPNTLFVVAAMNDGADADATPVVPCDFPSPNVVCVAATDSHDRLAGFSNYGAHNVDLAAPGVSIVSTYLKWGPTETLFSDDFEQPLDGRWVTGGTPNTWTRTPFVETRSGAFSLSNSLLGGYANGTDNWARLASGFDLAGARNCRASVWVDYSLGPIDPDRPPLEQDRVLAETARDGAQWRLAGGFVGTGTGFQELPIDLSTVEGRSTAGLRFRLVTDSAGTFGGVAVDDLRVTCTPPLTQYSGAHDEYGFYDGTSMAAPHVSGVAVLLLALQPRLTAGQLKQRILATVDRLPGLAGKTVTGGRLNAARAVAPVPVVARPPAGQTTHPGPSPAAMASVLKAQLRAIARTLEKLSGRQLLRRRGFVGVRAFAPAAGRLTLKLESAAGRTIAAGSCSVPQAGRCATEARLTRRGRALLRRARRPRVSVVLAFAPRVGAPIVHRMTVKLKPRQGGSR